MVSLPQNKAASELKHGLTAINHTRHHRTQYILCSKTSLRLSRDPRCSNRHSCNQTGICSISILPCSARHIMHQALLCSTNGVAESGRGSSMLYISRRTCTNTLCIPSGSIMACHVTHITNKRVTISEPYNGAVGTVRVRFSVVKCLCVCHRLHQTRRLTLDQTLTVSTLSARLHTPRLDLTIVPCRHNNLLVVASSTCV